MVSLIDVCFFLIGFMIGNVVGLNAGWRVFFLNCRVCIIEKKEGGLNRG
jgi:hypothetical protein